MAVTEPRAELRTFGGSLSRQASKSYKSALFLLAFRWLLVVGWLVVWLLLEIGNHAQDKGHAWFPMNCWKTSKDSTILEQFYQIGGGLKKSWITIIFYKVSWMKKICNTLTNFQPFTTNPWAFLSVSKNSWRHWKKFSKTGLEVEIESWVGVQDPGTEYWGVMGLFKQSTSL